MTLQVAFQSRSETAEVARKGLLSSVGPNVTLQVRPQAKLLEANRTLVAESAAGQVGQGQTGGWQMGHRGHVHVFATDSLKVEDHLHFLSLPHTLLATRLKVRLIPKRGTGKQGGKGATEGRTKSREE